MHGHDHSHDELWCFDIENIRVRREMSPPQAPQWGRVLDEVDERQRAGLYAWATNGDYVAAGTGELPNTSYFEDRSCGPGDSFDDYAHQLAGLITRRS